MDNVNKLTIIIDSLRSYFKSNRDLAEAGINLNKLEPHKMLYNLIYQMMIDKYGLEDATDIIRFAECSNKDDNNSFIAGFFKQVAEKTNAAKVNSTEPVMKPKKSIAPKTVSNNTKNESTGNPEYYVNGQKVSKEAYNEAELKFREFKSKYSHAFDDIFNDLFSQYFK